MKLEVRLKYKILHCFKRRHCEKLRCERTSQFYICVYIYCRRRRLPTDCILSFLFPAETDVLVPVFSQSTDVVVVNFVVVLKFPDKIFSSLLYVLRDGPLEKWWGGGGGEKTQKKFM